MRSARERYENRLGAGLPIGRTTVLVLLGVAVALRARQYASNTSISLDEADLALNLVNRSYSGLLHTLDFNQGAPPAFLMVEKLTLDAFGNSEYALRAVSLLAGITSVLLVIPFARRFVKQPIVGILALFLFGISASLVLYSAIGKPYALDVTMTLACYIVTAEVMRRPGIRWTAMFAIVGTLALWLSFASVFVLSGIGLTLILWSARSRRWQQTAAYSIAASTWLVSLAVLYLVSLRDLGHLQSSISTDTTSTGRDPLDSARTAGGAIRSLVGIANFNVEGLNVGRVVTVIAILLAITGVTVLALETPATAAMLVMPILLTLIAALLGRYPLYPRTLLFLAPGFLVLLAYGATRLASMRRARFVAILAMALLLAFVTASAIKAVFHPQEFADLKPALRYLAAHQQPADTLWIFGATQYEFRYYLECRCYGPKTLVSRGERLWPLAPAPGGPDQFAPALKSVVPRLFVSRAIGLSKAYREELRNLGGRRRVWILISEAGPEARVPIVAFLDRLGRGRRVFKAGSMRTTAQIYLYDLSHAP